MRRYCVTHTTRYRYQDSVSLAYNEVRLTPRNLVTPLYEQHCEASTLSVTPEPTTCDSRQDVYGNVVHHLSFSKAYSEMVVTARSEVVRRSAVSADVLIDHLRERLGGMRCADLRLRAPVWDKGILVNALTLPSPLIPQLPELKSYASRFFHEGREALDMLLELTRAIYQEFQFQAGVTTVSTPLAQVMAARHGVCQDFSHVMIGCLRSVGLAACYVSGYLETLPPPGQARLVGADASHAWCAVYLPNYGWLEFDPTNNLIPLAQHVLVGYGADYSEVTPIKGIVFGHGAHSLEVAVDVAPQHT